MTQPGYTEPAADAVAALLARSNRLGSDPKNTNYAGGNASAKGTETDPVTGQPTAHSKPPRTRWPACAPC